MTVVGSNQKVADDYDSMTAIWGKGIINGDQFVQVVYLSL